MIFLDIETTGFDEKQCAIASIGIYDTITEKEFYEECKIFRDAKIEPGALRVNKFTEEQLRDPNKKTLGEILNSTLEFVKMSPNRTIAGANPDFDRRFIQHAIKRYGILDDAGRPLHFGGGADVDVLSTCIDHYHRRNTSPPMKNGRISINADWVFKYVGIPSEEHHALKDAKMEAEAYSRLIHGKYLLEEYKHLPVLCDVAEKEKSNTGYFRF